MKRTRIFERYLFAELFPTFFLGLLVLTFVLLLKEILDLTELVVNKGLPLTAVLELLFYLIPSSLALTIPMALLVGTILAFSRLSADGEIIAMKSSGVSLARLLRPVLLFAFLVAVAHLFLILYGVPWGRKHFADFKFRMLNRVAQFQIRPEVFNDDYSGLVIFARQADPGNGRMEGVMIEDSRDPDAPQTIVARRGALIPAPDGRGITLRLQDGSLHREVRGKDVYQLLGFKTYDVNLEPRGMGATPGQLKDKALGLKALLARIARLKREGKNYYPALVELHKRFALPVANLLFALIGVPLGMVNRRSGKAGGFAFSIAVIFIYYLVTILGKGLSEDQVIHPAIAMWTPNALMAVLAAVLLSRASREVEWKWVERIFHPLGRRRAERRA